MIWINNVLQKIWNLVKRITENDKERSILMITIGSNSLYFYLKGVNAEPFNQANIPVVMMMNLALWKVNEQGKAIIEMIQVAQNEEEKNKMVKIMKYLNRKQKYGVNISVKKWNNNKSVIGRIFFYVSASKMSTENNHAGNMLKPSARTLNELESDVESDKG
jgi:hypothetical protein